MLKKLFIVGWGVVTVMVMIFAMTNLNFLPNGVHVVNAEVVCLTPEECEKQIEESRNRLSNARSQREEISSNFVSVVDELTEILDQIDETQANITRLESEIQTREESMNALKVELMELDENVENLQYLIANRMRVTQRLSNTNNILTFLSEADTIVDLVRKVRVINHLTLNDAELIDELNHTIERQQQLLHQLEEEQAVLLANREALKTEQRTLANTKAELEVKKATLAEEIQIREQLITEEEEFIRIMEEQKYVLEQTPPPVVVIEENSTSGNSNQSSSTSGSGNPSQSISTSGGSGKFIKPVASAIITCEWMCHPTHSGIDMAARGNPPILAAAAGTVVTSGWHNAYGNWVIIDHNFNGNRYSTLYAHLRDTPMVSVGDTVSQGQQIGNMGTTGNSTGDHLHFEIHPGGFRWGGAVNPRNYIAFPSRW